MKRILFAMTCAAAFVMAGCQKDIATDDNEVCSQPEAGTVCAYTDDVAVDDTRNSLVDEDGARHILWSAGDVIGIFGSEQGSNVKAVLDPATDGMRKGVFDYVGTISGIFCGYYPYNAEATLNGDLLTTELPRVQQYTPSSVFSPNVTIMAGYLRDTENELQFRNACSILEIQLTGEERITSLSLLSESKALSGKGTVNLADEEPKFIISEGVEGNANEIVLDLGDEGVQLTSDPTPFYFVIPAGTYPDLKVVAYADEFAFHRKSTQSHLLQPRHIVPMKPFAVGKPDYASAVDLSASEYANCYRVDPASEAVKYSFAMKHVDGSAVEGEPYLAECLWETSDGLLDNVSLDRTSGKIYFDVKGDMTVGNGLVSVLDENRKVLWSWHIWVSESADQTWGAAPYTFMDRNLGATWTPSSVEEVNAMTDAQAVASGGLMYQWGRNTPLPGANTLNPDRRYETESVTSGCLNKDGYAIAMGVLESMTYPVVFHKYYPEYQGWELRNLDLTMSEMAAYPLSFNKILTDQSDVYATSWASDAVATGENAAWGMDKTNTDPCPPGYRVPSYDEIFYFRNDGIVSGGYYKYTHHLLSSTSTDSYGGYIQPEGNLVWVPKSGLRTSGYNSVNNNSYTASIGYVGRYSSGQVSWWTFNPEDTQSDLDALSGFHDISKVRLPGDIYQRYFYMIGNGNMYDPNKVHAISSGCSVRCVKK